jgi:hypothetical protein
MSEENKQHYLDRKVFSQAVHDYVLECNETGVQKQVPNYIANGFMMICNGLSYKNNFNQYPFRDEMVMDAVENCLRAVKNYNIEAATRSGKPNAFGYFTQIAYYAFLRRIAKEKKQMNIKERLVTRGIVDDFIENCEGNDGYFENQQSRMATFDSHEDD